jgi:hypothetical protein
MAEVEPTTETSYISNILQTVDDVQRSVPLMNQPLSQTFRELFFASTKFVTKQHSL